MNLKMPTPIKYFIPAAGLLGSWLYQILFHAGLDARGLPDPAHWSHMALLLLTAAVSAVILLSLRTLPQKEAPATHCPTVFGGICCVIGALACLLFSPPAARTGFSATADTVMRGICTVLLCVLAYCRFTGKKPFFLFHGILCLYLAFRLINQYRFWSADPQILEYCFYLCGYAALMLAAYQQAAFDAGFGNFKSLWLWSSAAAFLCFVTLAGPQERLFMPAFGLWVLSGLSAVNPAPFVEEPFSPIEEAVPATEEPVSPIEESVPATEEPVSPIENPEEG